jgi:hypothetical protein
LLRGLSASSDCKKPCGRGNKRARLRVVREAASGGDRLCANGPLEKHPLLRDSAADRVSYCPWRGSKTLVHPEKSTMKLSKSLVVAISLSAFALSACDKKEEPKKEEKKAEEKKEEKK